MGTCMSTEDGMTNVGSRQPVMARNQLRHLKKRDKEALTIEGQRDLLLALTPGRMFRIGASGSACTHTQQGRKGCNQDAMLVWEGQHLVVGNVGDSRAIMGTLDDNGSWKAAQLIVDLKPSLPKEAERIRKCSGRVFALHDEPEIMRVWLPFEDSPGLAMARAFGDFCLKDYGVIAVPEITYCQVTDRDKFIILATDGIWDVLSNEEAVQIIATAPTRATAARSLVESAVRVWRLKYPASKVDDCAVVCLYLDRATDEDMFTEASALMSKESLPTSLLITPQNQSDVGVECVSMTTPVQEIRKIDLSSGKSQDAGVQEIGETLNSEEENGSDHTDSKRHRSLDDCLHTDVGGWSALDGVTRVNSILNLPRFPDIFNKSNNNSNYKLIKNIKEFYYLIIF